MRSFLCSLSGWSRGASRWILLTMTWKQLSVFSVWRRTLFFWCMNDSSKQWLTQHNPISLQVTLHSLIIVGFHNVALWNKGKKSQPTQLEALRNSFRDGPPSAYGSHIDRRPEETKTLQSQTGKCSCDSAAAEKQSGGNERRELLWRLSESSGVTSSSEKFIIDESF